jgi:hypothetical protein
MRDFENELFVNVDTEIRKYKIKNFLTTDTTLDSTFVSKKLYQSVLFASQFGIVTGSVALRMHGLLNREPSDVDVIVTKDMFKHIQENYKVGQYRYRERDIPFVGYITHKGNYIDFFIHEDLDSDIMDENHVRYDGVANIVKIKKKLMMENLYRGREKDRHDLITIVDILQGKEQLVFPQDLPENQSFWEKLKADVKTAISLFENKKIGC